MARLGLGRKKEEEQKEQQSAQAGRDAIAEGREYAKNASAAKQATKFSVVSEHPTDPFKQTAEKTDAQIVSDYDAEMAARDGMTAGNKKQYTGFNKISVDFSSIKDNDQAAYFASTLDDEKTRKEFLEDWAKYSKQSSETVFSGAEDLLGTRLFASPVSETGKNKATSAAAMQVLSSGLMMDADGNDVDLNGASLPMVIQSIRTDPDSKSRKEKTKALYELTQTPGNRFYGMTFDEDLANTFLTGADWDDNAYSSNVKTYQSAFYTGSGHDEENLKKYLELANEISGGSVYGDAYSPRQQRSMRAALDKAWTDSTGLRAPTDDDIAAWSDIEQTAKAEGKKTNSLSAFLFGDKAKKEEKKKSHESETTETQNPVQLKKTESGAAMQARFGSKENGGNVDLTRRPQVDYQTMEAAGWGDYTEPGSVSTVLTTSYGAPEDGFMAQMTPIQEDGSVLSPEELDEYYDSVVEAVREGRNIQEADPKHLVLASKHGTPDELESQSDWLNNYGEALHQAQEAYYEPERESVSTPGEAMTLYLKGEPLTAEENEMLTPYLESNAGRMLLNRKGTVSSLDAVSSSLQKEAKALNIPETIPSTIGSTLEGVVDVLRNGMLDDETAGMGYLALIQVMQDADAWIESGAVSIPAGKNPYNVYISTHDEANSVVQSIKDAQRTAIRRQQNEVNAQKQAAEEAYTESVQRVVAGTPTEEDLQRVSEAKLYGSSNKRADTTFRQLQTELNTAYFQEEGGYWERESAASIEGVEGDNRSLFRREVVYKANELLGEYADAANGLGMTTQEYLEKCGVSDLDQLCDMAYNRMVRQGNEFLNNPVAQEGLKEDDSSTIGFLPAVGAGVGGGAVAYADSFASAAYNLVDAATYEANRNDIMSQYNGEYGINGRAIYREQLSQYANSGLLSEEQSAALILDISRAKDIYDIGYKIDAGWLGNGYRSFLGALDNIQQSAQDFASLGNSFEQSVFNYSWSAGYSAAGMATAGAAGALGAGGLASSAIAYGTTTWNESYEESLKNGLSKQVSAALAVGPAVISTVVNKGEAAKEGALYGGRSLLEIELANMDAGKAATFWGKAKLYAKDMARTAISEGKEEVAENVLTDIYNSAMYPVAQKIESGQKPQFSDVLSGLSSLDPAQMLSDGANSFVGGAAGSVIFSLSGHLGLAIRRKMPGYTPPCITMSEKMLNGEADVTPENIAKVTESLAQELEKPEVAQAVNDAARQAQDAQNTVAAAMSGTGAQQFEEGNRQARMQQEAQAKSDAAQKAANEARTQFEEFSDAVIAGDLDKVKEMQAARVRMGENQKTANEYAEAAAKHKQAAQEAYNKGLDEARTRGAQISREQNAQTVENWMEEMQTMAKIADIDAEIAQMQSSYTEAETQGYDEDVRNAIDDQLHDLRMERIKIARPGLEEAIETKERIQKALSERENLGLDEETTRALSRQLNLAEAKERIYTQSKSDWALEESLYGEDSSKTVKTNAVSHTSQNYINPDAEIQLVGEKVSERTSIEPEERPVSEKERPGKVVVDTTFEEQYAPEIKQVDVIVKAGREASEIAQALKAGNPVSQKQIEQVEANMNQALENLSSDAVNVFASEIEEAMTGLGNMEVELDSAKKRDQENTQADMNRYMAETAKKENARMLYEALTPVSDDLRSRKIYVNPSQEADILSMTGFRTLQQVNRAYAINLTRQVKGATPLDGQLYVEIANQSGGYMNEASLHPEEDLIRAMMERRDAYRSMRRPVEKPKDRAQVRRAAKGVMGGNVGAENTSAPKNGKQTYRGIEVQETTGKADKGANVVKATKQLAKDIGIGSTIGARNMSEAGGANGYYREAMRYMAVDPMSAGRADVNMHEIGHAISERTGLTGTQAMIDNLIAENPAFEKSYLPQELAGEAMAEFTWRYMISDDAAKDFAGEGFVATFEQALEDHGMAKAVQKAKTDIRGYLSRGVNEKIGAMIVNRSDIPNNEKWDEAFLYALVDSTAPAEKANDIVRQNTGEKVVSFENNLRESALLRNTADRRAYGQLTQNLTDVSGTIIGDSLKKVFADSGLKGKDADLFWNCQLAKHSLSRVKQGKAVFDAQTLPVEEIRAYITKTLQEHPEFKEASKAFNRFRHDFMQAWMVDTGYMKQWQLDAFEAMYPDYVPTYRVKDNPQVGRNKNGGGSTFTIQTAKGSTEQIIHPFDSFAEMVQRIVRMNMSNQTNLMFDRLYHEFDGFGVLGRIIEQTESEYNDNQTKNLQEIFKEKLERADADSVDIADVLFEIDSERGKFSGNANENNIITVQHPDGRKTYYSITDPLFYKMMANATDSGSKVLGIIGKLTHAMSALTTGSNPVFAMRNFLRDFQSSVNYGTWATSYADALTKWIKTFGEVWKGDSADYQGHLAQGGGGWTRIETGNTKSAQELRGMVFDNGKWSDNYSTQTLKGKGKWAGKKLWEFATLARLNEVVEQTSRFVEEKYGKHDLTTAGGRAEAFRAGQEVTVDFGRKGASGAARDIGNIVPFFNASLQGVYRAARQATKQESGQAAKRFVKTVLNTGATVALANAWMLLGMDDDDKEAFTYMSDDLKSKHLFIPNFLHFGDAPLIRIPIEQDPVAYAVNTMMTNVMWKGEADDWQIDFTTAMATIADGLYPISGTIFDPWIATKTNKNWYGHRIVPAYMENWDTSTQYTDETAKMFVTLGRNIGVSPMMAQYVAQQYTGFLGQVVIPAMSDTDTNNPAVAMLNATVAYARQQLTSNPLKSNDVISLVYDNSSFLTTVVKAGDNGREMNMLRGDLTERQAQKAYADAYDMTHSGGVLYETKKTISEGYERINAINGRDDLTDEEKVELTDGIRRNMCRLALRANETYAKYEQTYVTGETMGSWLIKRAYGGTTIKRQK